ncbi:GNAT family N-acetyltransferase [Costertonia aggregata]|uniref:GNAT family N-acetyltransferase n=1 Tax=Costertonia aggregata TaxID=343403 RepID=A0A7H9ALR8_9FLAO|nr:GNAT family N-acetyltransferase [Costertonia aggregata]QLG44389.1 GNAT family N-acetyltransferase [Costertonia aggregata]
MEIHFEIATLEDLPDILEMMQDFNAIDNYPFNVKITEQTLMDFLGNTSLGRLWLTYMDDKIVGYVVLTFGFSFEYKGRDAFIDEFFIKKDFRHKGIGKKTMKFVLTAAKKLHVNAIHLEVEKHNKIGSKLYLKSGFNSTDRDLLTKCLIE